MNLEEGYPAAENLSASEWIARVAERLGDAARAASQVESNEFEPGSLLAAFSMVGAEAVRGAARLDPDIGGVTSSVQLAIDKTLDRVEERITRNRYNREVLTQLTIDLGKAASAAIQCDAEGRAGLVGDADPSLADSADSPSDALHQGLLSMAQVSAEWIKTARLEK